MDLPLNLDVPLAVADPAFHFSGAIAVTAFVAVAENPTTSSSLSMTLRAFHRTVIARFALRHLHTLLSLCLTV